MPYQAGERLPMERSSKLGHLDILKSELVNKLCESFEDRKIDIDYSITNWEKIDFKSLCTPLIFGIDGSLQKIEYETYPHKAVVFIKTSLLRIDHYSLSKIDKNTPHPFALRDILAESAIYHATVFPLRYVSIPGMNTYDTIRNIIFESLKDNSLSGEPMETLKWIVYEKWDNSNKSIPLFECPHCREVVATLRYNEEQGFCNNCKNIILITDMLGFHQEMNEDSASESIANTYMTIHETLMLFTGIRHFWENNRRTLLNCMFVKDGPLTIRAQYSKLVNPIRRFLSFSRNMGFPVCIIGQEKTGDFVDHLNLIGDDAPISSVFIPSDKYIKEKIQNRPDSGAPYGKDTNYGAKVFLKINDYHKMVLNIPTGEYIKDPTIENLIGFDKIYSTIPTILSNRHEGALLPIELAHGVASLSTYPSAQILKVFAEAKI